VGTTLEFKPRGSFEPIADMVGGGPFELEPGQWTDDTSVALCLATSLVQCRGVDVADQMRRYVRWHRDGYLSSTGRCFDIGNTVRSALLRFERTGEPLSGSTDPRTAGNGSIMRLAPVPMYYAADPSKAAEMAAQSSRTTHGAAEAVDACRLFSLMIVGALTGAPREDILFGHRPGRADENEWAPAILELSAGGYREKRRNEIKGSGYVVDSLEAALWCFLNTDSFADAVLAAANLGDDADTTAAVCGQLAGAHYGAAAIPKTWLQKLSLHDSIVELSDALMAGP